ncbi:mirror-image polydactyly gene 1 protein [Protopterus annectens]|uniref:mirror-image polydactyly gene 1 protein n=1 Tax=Protopterus annectens TaxID=7888 RepID=UPI001CFAC871|nr:mirror-image polydactyly gene 1 protein [Protopterus annectens]
MSLLFFPPEDSIFLYELHEGLVETVNVSANPKVNEELRGRLPAARQHLSSELVKEELAASFQDFCLGIGVLETSSKVMEQNSDLLEQTSSAAYMESWSKGEEMNHFPNKKDESVTEKNVIVNLHFKLHEPVGQVPDAVQQLNESAEDPKCVHSAAISSSSCTDDMGSSKITKQEYFSNLSDQMDPAGCVVVGRDPSMFAQLEHSNTALNKTNASAVATQPTDCNQLTSTASQSQRVSKELAASQTHGCFSTIIDNEKNISFLMKELDTMRNTNKKLQEKIYEKDRQLETLKLDIDLQEKAIEAKFAEKAAALIEEVYSAQRERDAAVMARLRLANEERDEAILRAKRLEQAVEELENINPEENDMTLQELLHRISNAESGLAIEKNGAVIVDRIQKTKERKQKITAEEMKAVIEERDIALGKCKRLEQELHHLKEQSQASANNTRHLTAANNQERALKAQLSSMQNERDHAAERCKKLEDELQTLRVYYSLHKSLSQEASVKGHLTSVLSSHEGALCNKDGCTSAAYHQMEELESQLQIALTEKADLEVKLQQALEAKNEANEKTHALERLVDVLRRKVGAGTVRTVI